MRGAARSLFFVNDVEMQLRIPSPVGPGEGYVGLPVRLPVYPLKPHRLPYQLGSGVLRELGSDSLRASPEFRLICPAIFREEGGVIPPPSTRSMYNDEQKI